jgi:hypothetical protein
MLTGSQFIANSLGIYDYPPPLPKKGAQFGDDDQCYLCGGVTDGVGWPIKAAIKPTSVMFNLTAQPLSSTVCQSCVATMSKDTFDDYAARRPELGLKTGKPMSWRCYSHACTEYTHECPDRPRWRQLLIDPPDPPFVFVISTSLQKHLLFRSAVSRDIERYFVLLEDVMVFVDRQLLQELFLLFEQLYTLGFSKDSILIGDYHHGQLQKVGLSVWRPIEESIAKYRKHSPQLMQLVHYCAQRETV